jgi:hypothetical protein
MNDKCPVPQPIEPIQPITAQLGTLPASRLALSTLSRSEPKPVDAFLLIPFGEVHVERPAAGESFTFTPAHAKSAKQWFDKMSRKLVIDYEHQSFERLNTRPDGLRPAAGWIGGLEIREDGLWATDITWTERARELLSGGEYRYFSPVIFWTDEDQTDVAGLGPVALTNDPAMRGVSALAASRNADLANDPTVLRQQLDAAQQEVAMLRTQLRSQQADAFVEHGLQLGKITDSTSMDWRADYLRDPEQTMQRLARSPVLLPPNRVVNVDPAGGVAPLHAADGAPTLMSGQGIIEPEDLAAFDRARAAGRILGTAPSL